MLFICAALSKVIFVSVFIDEIEKFLGGLNPFY